MVQQSEQTEDRTNVYVDAPTYTEKSNGIKCLYHLAKELADRGHLVTLVPRSVVGFVKLLPDEFLGLPIARIPSHAGSGVFICSESVPAAKVQAARRAGIRVLWWYLAPHGLLEKPRVSPQEGEAICCFSSYVLPDAQPSLFFQPPLDQAWRNAIRLHRPSSSHRWMCIGLYCGKGRLRSLPMELQRFLFGAEITLFTRTSPKSRRKLFRELQRCDGMISFDELTQLNLEAATMGVPVFLAHRLFPPESLELLPVPLTGYVTNSASEFIERVGQRRSGRLKPLRLLNTNQINEDCIRQFETLIADSAVSAAMGHSQRIAQLTRFGTQLRSKRILLPCDNGQAPSARLAGKYVLSFSYSRNVHRLVSSVALAMDLVGSALYVLKVPYALASLSWMIAKFRSFLWRR